MPAHHHDEREWRLRHQPMRQLSPRELLEAYRRGFLSEAMVRSEFAFRRLRVPPLPLRETDQTAEVARWMGLPAMDAPSDLPDAA